VADASYWIYIAHLPVVMALHVAFLDVSLPVWPKFAAVNAIAFAILFASYALLVRHSFIGATLNGKRPRGNRSTTKAAATAAAE
jgi:peptidoglycan/LPS O-acetylase OafA/YrhL